MSPFLALSRDEVSTLRKLSSPVRIQAYLDGLTYNKEIGGETCRSPRRVIRDETAHCFEGALLAAAALRFHGDPPWLLDLVAVRDDDHVLALYRRDGLWGAIGKSNYAGLRFRYPVYRTLRELVMSYFEHYYNLRGEKTLRAYSRPIHLGQFDRISWMTAEEDLWEIPEYLVGISHRPLLPSRLEVQRMYMDRRLYEAGMLGMKK